jgi:hypothetical protein
VCVWSASQAPAPAAAVTVTSPTKEGDGDDDERGADEEHEVDDSKLKLPGVKLADVKVATHEEDEDVVYKQCVPHVVPHASLCPWRVPPLPCVSPSTCSATRLPLPIVYRPCLGWPPLSNFSPHGRWRHGACLAFRSLPRRYWRLGLA